jgi:hypothetical protein
MSQRISRIIFGPDILARRAVCYFLNKFKFTDLVLDRKIEVRRHVLTEENVDDIGARLKHSPRKSLASLLQ